MSEISEQIWDYIFKQTVGVTPRAAQPPPGATRPKMPVTQPHGPRTPEQLPQFGIVARARAEKLQQRQNLVPIKHREMVHDKKTGKVYWRTRTIYMRPGEMQEKDPRAQMQAMGAIEMSLNKILNTGLRQVSLQEIDSLLARFKGMKGGKWPAIIESLMQLRAVMKKKDWRTSEWLLQRTMSMLKHARQGLMRTGTQPGKEQDQLQRR